MVKALWLTSWYPNRLDNMTGDFIQRHAQAAALFCNVHVIHLEAGRQNTLTQQTEVSVTKRGNLIEEIVLYKLPAKTPFAKPLSYLRYFSLFKKHIKAYIRQYGKPGIVHVHVPVKAGLLALWIKRKYGIAYIVTEHWAIYNNQAPDAFAARNFLFKYYTKKILQQAAMFTPVSNNLGEAVQKMVVNIPFTVIPNVVDTSLFNYEKPSPAEDDMFVFLHVSTLNYQKNPEGILRAFKQFLTVHPNAKLVMVGGVSDALLQYASSLNIPSQNIHFTGLITYQQVAVLMKAADVFVMFSRYENLPCVITEALCCGLPVIASSTGGIKEVVNKANGLLVKAQDEGGLLQAMLTAYKERNDFKRQDIAENAAALFGYTAVSRKLEQLYITMMGNQIYLPGK